MTDPEKPHKAIIIVHAEVQDVLSTGECSGRTVFEIKKFPLMIDGMNYNDTVKRLNETLEGLKTSCQEQTTTS